MRLSFNPAVNFGCGDKSKGPACLTACPRHALLRHLPTAVIALPAGGKLVVASLPSTPSAPSKPGAKTAKLVTTA